MEPFSNACRLCLWKGDKMIDVFRSNQKYNILDKIHKCIPIRFQKNDVTHVICQNCYYKLEIFAEFLTLCSRSDAILRRYVESQNMSSNEEPAEYRDLTVTVFDSSDDGMTEDEELPFIDKNRLQNSKTAMRRDLPCLTEMNDVSAPFKNHMNAINTGQFGEKTELANEQSKHLQKTVTVKPKSVPVVQMKPDQASQSINRVQPTVQASEMAKQVSKPPQKVKKQGNEVQVSGQDKPTAVQDKPPTAAGPGKQGATLEKHDSVQDKQVTPQKKPAAAQDKQVTVQNKQLTGLEKQASGTDKQVPPQKKQAPAQDKQIATPDKPESVQEKQVSHQKKQATAQDKQVSATVKQVTTTDKLEVVQDKQVTPQKKQSAPQVKLTSSPDKPVTGQDKQVTPQKKQAVTLDKQVTAEKQAAVQDKQITADKQAAVQVKQAPMQKKPVAVQEKQVVADKQVTVQDKQVSPQKKQAATQVAQDKQVINPDKQATPQGKQIAAQDTAESVGKDKREVGVEKQLKSQWKEVHDKQIAEELQSLLEQEKVVAALVSSKPKGPPPIVRHSPRLYNEYTRQEPMENGFEPAPSTSSSVHFGRVPIRKVNIRKKRFRAVPKANSARVQVKDVVDAESISVVVQRLPVSEDYWMQKVETLRGKMPLIKLNRVIVCFRCSSVFSSEDDLDGHLASACPSILKRKRPRSGKKVKGRKSSSPRKRTRLSWVDARMANLSPEKPETLTILESLGLVKRAEKSNLEEVVLFPTEGVLLD